MLPIVGSTKEFEAWLGDLLGESLVAADLEAKHCQMRQTPFQFLRATCWRWAELADELCPELMTAPRVLSVGDAHVGNFGLWRDAEARLVWGVNDFDEAAVTPYPLDLVRLCASAVLLADEGKAAVAECAEAIVSGYQRGLEAPGACILETRSLWLRDLFMASDRQRETFWEKLFSKVEEGPSAPDRFSGALLAALPNGAHDIATAPRSAGIGGLGRPRYIAVASFRGAPIAREVKALIPSCWERTSAPGAGAVATFGRFRSPDPWLSYTEDLLTRRLAPDSRKLDPDAGKALPHRLLRAMGRDLAAIHAAQDGASQVISTDLAERPRRWLQKAASRVLEANHRDWKQFRKG